MTFDQLSLIALGANMPLEGKTPQVVLRRALAVLADRGVVVEAFSGLYHTPCFPPGAGPDYVNATAALRSNLSPGGLLDLLHEVEKTFGRERLDRWGTRTLDLDLLAVDDLVLPDDSTLRRWIDLPADQQRIQAPDRLILPHPRMQDRAFVLVPLQDIAPGWMHPVLKKTVAQMCAALPQPDRDSVVAMT
ncbi:2-amino-4-hydroxy-6-hydroxymethyldihydropteridine diphosphokinase [Lacimonas salitolerans]|uniref:2-amino-4-hydroxy-6-hydroxymethyldihydropteridine pyrophosphokinase n=1 Tax=Lacimonas salitolerans TaxID=1323750 RepID=A0ABW4EK81_9RHOB